MKMATTYFTHATTITASARASRPRDAKTTKDHSLPTKPRIPHRHMVSTSTTSPRCTWRKVPMQC
jgi:hypothetical protein